MVIVKNTKLLSVYLHSYLALSLSHSLLTRTGVFWEVVRALGLPILTLFPFPMGKLIFCPKSSSREDMSMRNSSEPVHTLLRPITRSLGIWSQFSFRSLGHLGESRGDVDRKDGRGGGGGGGGGCCRGGRTGL